jgi:hypothetical protein
MVFDRDVDGYSDSIKAQVVDNEGFEHCGPGVVAYHLGSPERNRAAARRGRFVEIGEPKICELVAVRITDREHVPAEIARRIEHRAGSDRHLAAGVDQRRLDIDGESCGALCRYLGHLQSLGTYLEKIP